MSVFYVSISTVFTDDDRVILYKWTKDH